VNWHRVVHVQHPVFGVQEADAAHCALGLKLGGAAREHCADDLDVVTHVGELLRREAHRVAACEARADAENDAPRGERVQ
jgi:hypothetical protein